MTDSSSSTMGMAIASLQSNQIKQNLCQILQKEMYVGICLLFQYEYVFAGILTPKNMHSLRFETGVIFDT